MDKIIKACRAYQLKKRALPIILSAVLAIVFFSLGMSADMIFGEELSLLVPFMVLAAIALIFLIRDVWKCVFSRPGRLRIHLGNLPSEERAALCREFLTATPEHGRYFLSEFMLFFPFEAGIIRYSKIDDVSVYPTSVGISGGGRLIFIKTEKSENPETLAEKLLERMPERPEICDDEENPPVEIEIDAAAEDVKEFSASDESTNGDSE